ncbi:hypothetical protein FSP39_000797 [Pinctada imbricata]|uniref:Uncharacterized protein n=1 Tax=Pinctada imbricata TaxID=66713 RepID=A0AA88YKY2_PINIB|nr:hypothetical protein FSP39_000797 [Pinctada imbricata]
MEGKLKVGGGLNLFWTDEIIRWNPFHNGNVSKISLPATLIWHPVFYLVNSANNMDISSDLESCTYKHTGESAASHGFIVSSLCSPNTRFYPYDEQECTLTFSTLKSKFHINPIAGGISLNEYEENSKWEILNPRVENGRIGIYPTIDLKMTIKRRPTFLMLTFVLPIVLLGFMNLFVFILSNNSGERISFSVTVLLSFAVFITLISDKMPHTSNNLSLLCVYLLTALMYSSAIVVSTIISINIYNINDFAQLPTALRVIINQRLKSSRRIGEEDSTIKQCTTKNDHGSFIEAHIHAPSNLSDQCKIMKAGQLVDTLFLTLFGTIYLLGSTVFLAIISS